MALSCISPSNITGLKMSVTVISIAILLAIIAFYLLINVAKLLNNKLNQAIKLVNRPIAFSYFIICCLGYIPLYYFAEFERKQAVAEQYGYSSFDKYQAELNQADSFGLPLQAYQREMKKVRDLGLTNYQDYVNLLEAQDYGYEDFESYQNDVNLAQQYGLPLYIYRDAKEDAKEHNFSNFDDYLVDREKRQIAIRMENIAALEGDFNIDTVPLSVDRGLLLSSIDNCKISKIPDFDYPQSNTLAPRRDALVGHFFPETDNNNNFGLSFYSVNSGLKPGLNRRAITKHEMKCQDGRYNLWFLNQDNALAFYEKTIQLPNVRQHAQAVSRVTQILAEKCDSDISVGLEASFEENGSRKIKNMYCKNFQDYIIATIVEGAVINDVRQEADIHIGYLSERQWSKYINAIHASKGKKQTGSFTQNVRNKDKRLESRI